ncbi:DUF924 domain-containing protein [Octadecabacter sp. G9-8]|uniref:DUF924 domain-containing protein n=1 Tax=Octadecabacter dasysiphoniae TaxID=2909341 RepID=A0ABS9D290_9RHOB|nr:DUF924 family protein [Octadecabacter dasysiphoniae]MCF2872760.1 DUF924 domain-containing protein [Octadecabacter dasysiphoniae]
MITPEQVISYWVDEIGPKGWYAGGAELDAEIREKFEPTLREAQNGACGLWLTSAVGILGYVILTDQLTRNMFRGEAEAFAMDSSARSAAKTAIERDWDLRIPEPERQFFYLPLMHSENLIDQDRCVRLMCKRLPDSGADNLRHACAHRDVVRQFGRFPYRNKALGRTTTAAEAAWMEAGGYALALKAVDEKAAV